MIGYLLFLMDFGGYYENQVTILNLKQDWFLQDYNRLRLELNIELGERVSFNGDGIIQTFHGKTQYNILDFIPDSLAGLVPDSLKPAYIIPFSDRYYLDNAVLSLSTKYFILSLGKQQLAWGTGYVWNPTEVIRPKSLFDPTYEREGVNALRITIPWTRRGALEGILLLKESLDSSTLCIRLQQNLLRFDFAFTYAKMIEESWVLRTKNRRELYGAEFAGELFGAGVWAEGAYNNIDDTLTYSQLVVGADYTFTFQTYILTEYFHNGLGNANKEYDFTSWLRLVSGELRGLGRDYLFFGISQPVFEVHRLSLYLLTNLNDKSFIIMPQVQYSFSEDTEISCFCFYSFGDAFGEFSNFGIKGGFLRLRLYF